MEDFPSTSSPGIIEANLRDFFFQLIQEAAQSHRTAVSQQAVQYVTDVLVSFHETAKLFAQQNVRIPVLADMLASALEADFYRKITLLRQMGDTSLMVTGYFPEALSRRTIDVNYYQQMGEIAYSQLGALSEEQSIFDELSRQFSALSSLINSVAEQTHKRDLNVFKLIELYMRTGSEHTLQKLKKQGVIPLRRGPRVL